MKGKKYRFNICYATSKRILSTPFSLPRLPKLSNLLDLTQGNVTEMFIYLLLFLNHLSKVSFSITIPSKGTLPLDKNSIALQFYFDVKNENQVACRVATKFKRCCSSEEQDCNSMFLYGRHEQNIMPTGQESFVFVYPSVFHHDKSGVCYFIVDSNCGQKIKRITLDIPFDTKLASMGRKSQQLKRYIGQRVIRKCDSLDEDGLNDCSPVNCEMKYIDEKTFYDVKVNKCVRAATCIGRMKKDLPTMIYLPNVNLCRDLEHPVQLQDLYAISNGMSVVTDIPKNSPELTVVIETNCSTISEKLGFLEDILKGKMYPIPQGVQVDYSETCKMTMLSILGYIVGISAMILACVCTLRTFTWLFDRWYDGDIEARWIHMKQTFKHKTSEVTRLRSKLSKGSEEYTINDFSPDRNNDVKNCLLRDVINCGIPIELRSSVVDVCDRIGKDVKWKKRYRVGQVGTPFEFEGDSTTSNTSSADSLRGNTSVTSDEEKLLE